MIATELLIIVALSILNGLFSMSELAVVSSRKTLLADQAKRGLRGAQAALRLLDNPGSFFSTVQVGITLIGITSGVFAGATLAENIEASIRQIPLLAQFSGFLSYGVVVLFITYVSLVLGELVPKQLALAHPEACARGVAPMVSLLGRSLRPIVWLLDRSAKGILKFFRVTDSTRRHITEEEVALLFRQAAREGVIEPAEENIANKVLHLGDRTAGSIMTPRPDVVWIDSATPIDALWQKVSSCGHSYFPVANHDLDDLVGIVCVHDIGTLLLGDRSKGLLSIVTPALKIPATISILRVLELLKERGDQLAVVINEYGRVDGVLSLHDLAESLVGEISGDEEESPSIVSRGDGSYLIDASSSVEDVFATLGLGEVDDEYRRGYHSLGGFFIRYLNESPKVGDRVSLNGFTMEVVDMDKRRLDKILLTKTGTPQPT